MKSGILKFKLNHLKTFKLRNIYRMKKLSYYCNIKDKVPEYIKSHVVYEFCCPACNSKYNGKTEKIFGILVQE